MNRRHFLTLAASSALAGARGENAPAALGAHRVTSLEIQQVPLPWPRHVGRNSKLGAHGLGPTARVVVLKTDQGATGWGELAGKQHTPDSLRALAQGKTVAALFHPATGILDPKLAPLDVALHDLAGVILGLSVAKMLGAAGPQVIPVYSGMIYFDDLDPQEQPAGIEQILKNCAADRDYGYRQLKVKIGRGKKWMSPAAGLQRDIEVVRAIAAAFPECELLVDGNDGFTPESIIAFLKGIDGIPLYWLEEPFLDSDADWRAVHAWTKANGRATMLLADGEQGNNFPVLEKLEADGILNVRLTDIIGYGFTAWRALMPRLIKTHTLASPHAWGSGLKTVYAAQLVAGLGNGASVEGVTCSHEHVDFGENLLRDGTFQVSSKAGFGLALRHA